MIGGFIYVSSSCFGIESINEQISRILFISSIVLRRFIKPRSRNRRLRLWSRQWLPRWIRFTTLIFNNLYRLHLPVARSTPDWWNVHLGNDHCWWSRCPFIPRALFVAGFSIIREHCSWTSIDQARSFLSCVDQWQHMVIDGLLHATESKRVLISMEMCSALKIRVGGRKRMINWSSLMSLCIYVSFLLEKLEWNLAQSRCFVILPCLSTVIIRTKSSLLSLSSFLYFLIVLRS